MRLSLIAVGRLRDGPERALVEDYLERAGRLSRPQGFAGPVELEVEPRRASGRAAEAEAIVRTLEPGMALVCLDERGRTLSSPDFAARLGDWRDAGRRSAGVVIGGAEGLDADLRGRADLVLSFGPMVWPHMLARVMAAEQLYRAMSILAGTPYHRG